MKVKHPDKDEQGTMTKLLIEIGQKHFHFLVRENTTHNTFENIESYDTKRNDLDRDWLYS